MGIYPLAKDALVEYTRPSANSEFPFVVPAEHLGSQNFEFISWRRNNEQEIKKGQGKQATLGQSVLKR